MSQFNYETYAEAIKGLAMLPEELQQSQQKAEALFLNQKKQIEAATKSQLDELEKAEQIAFQQFDDIACEYKVLFSVPVSRPQPVPTPLSFKDAVAAQNILALQLKSYFDEAKQAAVEKKRIQIEAAKIKQACQAALKAQEEENRRKQAAEAERLQEEEYCRQLERENRSTFKKFIDFLMGQ